MVFVFSVWETNRAGPQDAGDAGAAGKRQPWERSGGPLGLAGKSAPQPSQSPIGGAGGQKGRTITRMTISTVKMPGTSFMMRSERPSSGRSPRASFLPKALTQPW